MSNNRDTSQQQQPLTKANIFEILNLNNSQQVTDQELETMSDVSVTTDRTGTTDTGILSDTSRHSRTTSNSLPQYDSNTYRLEHGLSFPSNEDFYNSSNSNSMSSISTDVSESHIATVTRSVQSYLKASSTARNYVNLNPYQMARVKRLNQNYRRGKLNDLTTYNCKFETKNLLLKQLLHNFDAIQTEVQIITDLKSKATCLSQANSMKIQNLFSKHECYLTTVFMPLADNYDLDNSHSLFSNKKKKLFEYINPEILPNIDNRTTTEVPQSQSFRIRQDPEEYFTCPLCNHCLFEPITLICGCTYCNSCLKEYNAYTLQISTDYQMKKMTYDSSKSDLMGIGMSSPKAIKKPEYECFNCAKSHEKNTSNDLKVNTMISLLVQKLWTPNLEVKKLRNEIRSFVVFDLQNSNGMNKLNLDKYEYLFKQAYDRDQSNHLILADLCLINHFSGHYEKSLQYADQIVELKPKWTFGYFLKSICNEKLENLSELKLSLEMCLSLDPTLSLLKTKLDKLNKLKEINVKKSKSPRHSPKGRRASKRGNPSDGVIIDPREQPSLSNTLRDKSFKNKLLQLKTNSEEWETIADNKTFDLKMKVDDSSIRKLSCDSNTPSTSTSFEEIVASQDMEHLKTSKSNSDQLIYTGDKTNILNNKPIDNDFDATDLAGEVPAKKKSISNEKMALADAARVSSSLEKKNNPKLPLNVTDNEPVANNRIGVDVMSFICEVNAGSSKKFIVDPDLLKVVDVECSLCYRILYNPVTTPCGHSYCSSCLDRSLDHQDKCPLCKSSLDEYLAERRKFVTHFLEKLIKGVFQIDFEEREKTQNEELQEFMNDDDEVPIFVCTLALPFAPCPLHIYEPRYRLMLRRAIESGSRQFGMCMYGERMPYHFNEYGCMLEIRNYQFTRDGRAVVATVGGRRFKVLKVNNKDGYYVAKVQWVTDVRVIDEAEKAELQSLHDEVFQLSLNWYNSLPTAQKKKIKEIYGISDMPIPDADIQADNGPVWHWFLLNILPLENDLQYRFLTKTSLKDRLKQIKRIVQVLLTPHASRPIVNSNSKDSISNNSAASHYTTTNNNNNNMTNTVTNTTSLNDVANTDTYTTSNEDTPENQNQL